MVKLQSIKESKQREAKGIWVDYEMGIQFKIAKMGNPKFQAKVRQLSAPHIKQIRDDKLPPEKMEEIQMSAVAETILLGWKNIDDDDGKAIRYSAKRAKEILSDIELRDIYDFVLVEANNQSNYEIEVGEDSAKN
tara:strand:+ start:9386 stop:9790 length:405 start_codon:yes stop_codon:yes gene_type:complete